MRNRTTKQLAARPDSLPEITPEMVELYVRRGRRLQALAFAGAMRGIWSVLGLPARRRDASAEQAPPGEMAETARNALAAIRSSAELLREDGIAPAERSRFAEIVLVEERRLGAVLAKMLDAGRRSAP